MYIELQRMAPTGEAIGQHDGLVIFVPFGMPGDKIEAEITFRRKNYARARITQILHPSPQRVPPPCQHFGLCGGCEWQHIPYLLQLEYKTNAVKEQLSRVGKIKDALVRSCIASPVEYHYRNHMQFALSAGNRPAYHQPASSEVVEIEDCRIVDPAINALIANCGSRIAAMTPAPVPGRAIRGVHIRVDPHTAETTTFLEYDDGSISSDVDAIQAEIAGYRYTISPASFFQVNTAAAELLLHEVLHALGLNGHERVLDLYCGVGLFTLPISNMAGRVVGVETGASAVRDAATNLQGHTNAQVIQSSVEQALWGSVLHEHWDAIVVDPPRAGVNYDALISLLHLHAERIVYVSCDPATLARDARILCDRGYSLTYIQPLDMFPQTHHVEAIALFSRAAA